MKRMLISFIFLFVVLSACNIEKTETEFRSPIGSEYLSLSGESETWKLDGYQIYMSPERYHIGSGELTMKGKATKMLDFLEYNVYTVEDGKKNILDGNAWSGGNINAADAKHIIGSIKAEESGYLQLDQLDEIFMVVSWNDSGTAGNQEERIVLYNKDEPDAPIISKNEDSEYEHTFTDLNLGIVFDFDFYLPSADKRWVKLWVERYNDGKKDSQPLTQLSYGNSPEEVDEGHLGFGIINPNSEDTLVFLYGPNASTQPSIIENEFQTDVISSWEYTIGKEEVKLKLGETKILAIYRETKGNSMSTIDLQDEESINKAIKQNEKVLLLKLKVEEKNEG